MASRLYFGNGVSPITTTTKGGWGQVAGIVAKGLTTGPYGGAATIAISESSNTNNFQPMMGRWTSAPLQSAYNFTSGDTIDISIGALQSSSAVDTTTLFIWVTNGDADTSHGTLLALSAGGTTWPTSVASRYRTGIACASVNASAGDRIVVELGYNANDTSTTSFTGTVNYGNTGTTDLNAADGDTNVTTRPGWIQFSPTNLFGKANSAKANIKVSDNVVGNSANANIKATTSQANSGRANVVAITPNGNSAKANIKVTDNTTSNSAKASIKTTVSSGNSAKANIAHNRYWIGGTGNWSDIAHWSASSGGTSQVVDYYPSSNYTGVGALDITGAALGQTFTGDGQTLGGILAYIKKNNSPTGSVYVKVYSHTGTWGSSGVPNTLLATSDAVSASGLSSTISLVNFNFSGANQITLTNGTHYALAVCYDGDATNNVWVGFDSTGNHAGNKFYYYLGWNAQSAQDLIFYVRAVGYVDVPTSSDDVYVDANSGFGGGGTITMDVDVVANCNNFTSTVGHAWTLDGSVNDLTPYGNVTFESGLTTTGTCYVDFCATTTGKTITINGATLDGQFRFFGSGGGWTLQDNLVLGSEFYMENGTFDANDHNVTANDFSFSANTGYTPTVIMGSGTWEATQNGWMITEAGGQVVTITSESSTIKILGTGAATEHPFLGAGKTYNNFWGAITQGYLLISGSNIFNELKFTNPPYTIWFDDPNTQTVNSFVATGTAGNVFTMEQYNGVGQWTLTKSSGVVDCDYLNLAYSTATGGATWNAGIHSTDSGNNTGWLFTRSKGNSAKANIAGVITNSTKGNIRATTSQSSSAKANIISTVSQANSSKASIVVTTSKDGSVKADILATITASQSAKANILAFTTVNNSTKADILVTTTNSNQVKADILARCSSANDVKANISNPTSQGSSTKASILRTETSSQSVKADILTSNQVGAQTKANIVATVNQGNASKANILTSQSQNNLVLAHIFVLGGTSYQYDNVAKASILVTNENSSFTKANLVAQYTSTNYARASVVTSNGFQAWSKANITTSNTVDNEAKASIVHSESVDTFSKANLGGKKRNYARANIASGIVRERNMGILKNSLIRNIGGMMWQS